MAEEFKPQYTFTEDRLNELKQLFPEAFEDGVFNLDTLRTLIGEFSSDSNAKEHFGLNWVGKQDARKIASKPPTGTLKPCPGEGVNEEDTENIFIEGENLEVLKILRKSYMGKIKMIYIDPPYNTGNDFIYNDTFADSTEDYLRKTGEKSDEGLLVSNPKSSGKYHANWLSFMYPRLRLAKDLLKEDGLIFISIDENEITNLKLMLDEIYGEENWVETVIWKKRYGAGGGTNGFAKIHEYLLVYSKTPILSIEAPLNDEQMNNYSSKDEKFETRGGYITQPLATSSKGERKNLMYTIFHEGNSIEPKPGNRWIWSEEKFKKAYDNNEIVINKNDNGFSVRFKQYLKDENGVIRKGKPLTIKSDIFNQDGTSELAELFGKKGMFDFPKPSDYIKYFLNIIVNDDNDKNYLVLDFFSGSGSTAHAIIKLNQEDGGNRKFIAVQLPEKIQEGTIAFKSGYSYISEITKARIKKAIENVDNTQGFKVLKHHTSTIYKWQEFIPEKDGAIPDLFSKMELAYKNPLQDGVTTQDFITEVILQEGFPLTAIQEEVVSGIYKITHDWVPFTLYATMLYSFKNTDFAKLQLNETDHFVCLDKAFEGNDALKQQLDNQCKLYTI
jgi:adenine-specific DNA-methyltransferase